MNRHNNVRFMHLGADAARLLSSRADLTPDKVAGDWVRVAEFVAALHVEAELQPDEAATEALLSIADGLAASAARLRGDA